MKIQNMELTENDIGRAVKYIPLHAHGDESHPDVEYGTITSFNKNYVFVRYKNRGIPQATSPDDLIWSFKEVLTAKKSAPELLEAAKSFMRLVYNEVGLTREQMIVLRKAGLAEAIAKAEGREADTSNISKGDK